MEINKTNSNLRKEEKFTNVPKEKQMIFVISKMKKIKNWTKEEDSILMKVAKKFEYKNWNAIAEHLQGRTAIQCSARYKRIRPGIIKGAWTEEEDEFLLNLLKKFGKNWSLISKYMPSRSGKQIRDRFLNALDPNILKEKFTTEEDKKILDLYAKLGSSWSKIAKYLSGRTGDMIKNRFYSSLRKQIHHDDYREGLKKKKMNLLHSANHSDNLSEFVEGKENAGGIIDQKEINENSIEVIENKKIEIKKINKSSFLKRKRRRVISNSLSNKKFLKEKEKKKEKENLGENGKNENVEINHHDNLNILSNNLQNLHSFNQITPMNIISNININNNFNNDCINSCINQLNYKHNFINNNNKNEQEGNNLQNMLNFSHMMFGGRDQNMIDLQMAQLTNKLLYNSRINEGGSNSNNASKESLENQLSMLRDLLNFTYMKLDYFRRNERANINSFNSLLNLNMNKQENTLELKSNYSGNNFNPYLPHGNSNSYPLQNPQPLTETLTSNSFLNPTFLIHNNEAINSSIVNRIRDNSSK